LQVAVRTGRNYQARRSPQVCRGEIKFSSLEPENLCAGNGAVDKWFASPCRRVPIDSRGRKHCASAEPDKGPPLLSERLQEIAATFVEIRDHLLRIGLSPVITVLFTLRSKGTTMSPLLSLLLKARVTLFASSPAASFEGRIGPARPCRRPASCRPCRAAVCAFPVRPCPCPARFICALSSCAGVRGGYHRGHRCANRTRPRPSGRPARRTGGAADGGLGTHIVHARWMVEGQAESLWQLTAMILP